MLPAVAATPLEVIVAAVVGALLGALLGPVVIGRLRLTGPGPRVVTAGAAASCAVLFSLVSMRFGLTIDGLPYAALAVVCAMLTMVDLAEQRLPNMLVLIATGGFAALLGAVAIPSGGWGRLEGALLGGAAMFAVYAVLALLPRGQLGGGDVKLAFVLGAAAGALSIRTWLICLVGGFFLNAACSLVLLALRRVTLSSSIPFGPWMIAGTFLAVAVH